MHELSIAQNILDIVKQYLPEGQRTALKSIRLRIGTEAGIVADSLRFSFEAVTAGTPMAGTALEIESVPFTLQCRTCGTVSTPDEPLTLCPSCASNATDIISGTELQVVELELDDLPRGRP